MSGPLRPKLLLAGLLLLAPPAAGAQEMQEQESSSDEGGRERQESEGGKSDAVAPMTLADAQANFQTVIENFINERSPNGHWTLKEKLSKNVLKLKLRSVDVKSIRLISPGHFSGRAELIDLETSVLRGAEFKVDLSADRWKVEGMRLLPAAKKPKSDETRRPAKTKP